jgi:hypothetical protein
MNIIIIILAVLITPFVLAFILGVVGASIFGSDKRRRAKAMISLSQMTAEQRIALRDIYVAYKANDVERANKVSNQASLDTMNFLINFFDYSKRPMEYSSGNVGQILWLSQIKKLRDLGYSEAVSKILPIVIMDNYNEVLEKMSDK